ncbi:MAG: AraC family transcriptional regulator [SAR86 cluster bacterium]|uniref:AraC family transcriptional regulator n=1 Tax=SAR86 cluster bacterium TaxID=2030880 RepID=A0A2A5B7N4_9GAMM|nr:MAG: AraC family transcriptional regulator [SAR86 cluster bacterium]
MPILLQYLFVIGTFQGFLLSSLLLFTPNISYASRILGLWCSLLALGLLLVLIVQGSAIEPNSLFLALTGFLPASYGAFLYLYCRHSVLDDGFQRKDLLHLIPVASCYLLNFDLILAPDVVVQAYLQGVEPTNIRYILGVTILYAQAFIYIAYSVHFLYRYQQRAQNNYASFNPDVFDWLWIVQGFNLIIWSSKVASIVLGHNIVLVIGGDILIVVLIYTIGMAQWRNPLLFRIAVPLQEALVVSTDDKNSKIAGALDESTRISVLETVDQYMKQQQAFLDNELSLRRLSEAVGVSTHHLSEVLNQKEGQNFYNFVNDFRVEYVCECLKLDNDIGLLDLGLKAGFSSKSSFNSVFKKHTGVTPSQYRIKVSNSAASS